MRILAVALIAMWATSLALAEQGTGESCGSRVVHVVLVWLKEPGNQQHRQAVIEATRGFEDLPGVEQIRVGVAISSDRSSVDDSFDVGLYMTFASKNALDAYLNHPAHQQAQRSILRPLVSRVLVYDFHDNPD